MVKRSVRRRRTVTAADLKSAQKQSKKRKATSLTRAARERFVARAKERGLIKRVADNAAAALPVAPTKLQQREAMVKAGTKADGSSPSLTARVRALYEDGVAPVREIARLCGVSERTLYKYAARGGWRKRYERRALAKGAGGRFIATGEAGAQPAGLKALDPRGAQRALAACAEAATIAGGAARTVLAEAQAWAKRDVLLDEFDTRVRRLALLTRLARAIAPVSGNAAVLKKRRVKNFPGDRN